MGGASRGNAAPGRFAGHFCVQIHHNVTEKLQCRRTYIGFRNGSATPQRLCYLSDLRMQQIVGQLVSRRAWRRPRRRERLARKLESLVVQLLEGRDPQATRTLGNP
jgi:hypothetical protein